MNTVKLKAMLRRSLYLFLIAVSCFADGRSLRRQRTVCDEVRVTCKQTDGPTYRRYKKIHRTSSNNNIIIISNNINTNINHMPLTTAISLV